jgi:hypothetical protein
LFNPQRVIFGGINHTEQGYGYNKFLYSAGKKIALKLMRALTRSLRIERCKYTESFWDVQYVLQHKNKKNPAKARGGIECQ